MYVFINLAVLGLSCGMWIFLVACRLFVGVHGLLSSCSACAPNGEGSLVVVCGLSCLKACRILFLCIPCNGRRILNRWTAREVPQGSFQGKKAGRRVKEYDYWSRGWRGATAVFEMKEEGCEPSNAGSSRSWKKSPLEAPGERQSCWYIDFSPLSIGTLNHLWQF